MSRKFIAVLAALLLMLIPAGCRTAPGADATATMENGALSTDEASIKKFESSLKSVEEVDFTLEDLNGRQWTLSDLKGKVVLLNFWATWCGPCQKEMPGFEEMYRRFGEDGDVIVLAVASAKLEGSGEEASRATVEGFVEEQNFTFPVLFDPDGAVWAIYQQEGIPANYIIDRQGNIRLLVSGAFKDEETMYAALEAVRRADSGQ